MTISNVDLIDAYAELSLLAYENNTSSTPLFVDTANNGRFVEIAVQVNASLGFQARAFFNTAENELVIGFAGTE